VSPRRLPASVQIVVLSAAITGTTGLGALAVSKWLGATDRGTITAAQTVTSLIANILALGLLQSARLILSDPGIGVTLRDFVRVTRVLMIGAAAVSLVLAFTLFPFLIKAWDPVLNVGFVLLALAVCRAGLLRESLHGVGWHRATLAAEAAGGLFSIIALVIAWVTHHLSLHVALFAFVGAACVHLATQALLVRRAEGRLPDLPAPADGAPTRGPETDWQLLRRLLILSLPALGAAIGVLVSWRLDRVLLSAFKGPQPLGIYSMAGTISDLAWTLPVALTPVIVRGVAQSGSAASHARWWRRIMLTYAGLAVLLLAAGSWLLEVFLAGDFHGSTPILAILLVGSAFTASMQVDLAVCTGMGNLAAGARAALWGVLVGTAGYLLLIPPFGAIGCAVANVLTFASMAVAARILLRRQLAGAPTAAA